MSVPTTFTVFESPEQEYSGLFFNSKDIDFPAKCTLWNARSSGKNTLDQLGGNATYREKRCTEILQGTNFPPMSEMIGNGLVDTVIKCFNGHHNLTLRPDDIWTAIITQFSFYVNKHAESFRAQFVQHEGKKELVVTFENATLRTVSYDLFAKLMSKKIDENLVDPNFKAWILPSFSTTTDEDLVTCGVVFMAAMKRYFEYRCDTLCGIPSITLEGTVEDWENILVRLEKLKEYHLGWWSDMLVPIMKQFVEAKKGNPDVTFWKNICHYYSGSGGTSITGWITAFCVFNQDGTQKERQHGLPGDRTPRISSVPPGIVDVEVKINDNGTIYWSTMFAGQMAYEILEDGYGLRPRNGWAICLKPCKDQ